MATTIQISNSTKQSLTWLKQAEKASTYDEVIQNLVKIHTKVPKSMFGAVKGLKTWTKKDRMEFHEL